MEFKGKIVLITGAASGMGAATAREFRTAGARVVLVDRNGPLVKSVSDEMEADEAGTALPLVGDVSDSKFCGLVVEETINYFGKLDVLVNAAGVIAGFLRGLDWHGSAVLANVLGALAATRAGAGGSMPRACEVLDLLHTQAPGSERQGHSAAIRRASDFVAKLAHDAKHFSAAGGHAFGKINTSWERGNAEIYLQPRSDYRFKAATGG